MSLILVVDETRKHFSITSGILKFLWSRWNKNVLGSFFSENAINILISGTINCVFSLRTSCGTLAGGLWAQAGT